MNVQFVFACSLILFPGLVLGQIYVDPNNNVGIGTALPFAKLEVYATPANGNGVTFQTLNSSSTTTKGLTNIIGMYGTGSRYGIHNTVYTTNNSTGKTYGIYSNTYSTKVEGYGFYNTLSQSASAISQDVYGIYNDIFAYGYGGSAYGEYTSITNMTTHSQPRFGNSITVLNGEGAQYGIDVACFGNGQSYAGWFSGDVAVSGDFLQLSDARTKLNVRTIDGALGAVRQLAPRAYEYRQDMGLGLPEGKNFGFIAQDLEKVLPELVTDALAPVHSATKGGKTEEDATVREGEDPQSPPDPEFIELKSVNYIQLIPILTQAVQELADQVDAQAATIAAQAQTIEALRTEIRNR